MRFFANAQNDGIYYSDRTHYTPPLEREGVTVSCAKHTVKNLFTSKKAAFTLTEVLITLGIIGIVAALTMPNIIAEHRKKSLKTQFISMYSIINQALLITKQELGSNSLFDDYTLYLPGRGYVREKELQDTFYKNLKVVGNASLKTGDYSIYSDKNIKIYANNRDYSFMIPKKVLPNGATIAVYVVNVRIYFIVDINGKKAPNRYGHDLFQFVINAQNDKINGIKKIRDYTEEELGDLSDGGINNLLGVPCSKNSKQLVNGNGCSWYALNDICPDDETKGYWECLPR